jgi:hypothetical protein
MLPSTDTRADKHNELKFERVTGVREEFLPPLRNQNVPFVQLSEQASHKGELVHVVEAGAITQDEVTQLGDGLRSRNRSRLDLSISWSLLTGEGLGGAARCHAVRAPPRSSITSRPSRVHAPGGSASLASHNLGTDCASSEPTTTASTGVA